MVQPMLLQPAFKDYLWGGERLKTDFGKQTAIAPLAESWELSCHPDGESTIASGPFAGQTLAAALQAQPELLGSAVDAQDGFPLMIKLIDAKQSLSVQVHPDDEYAARVEHSRGKTEMWVIVDCEPGAELLYGFSRPVTREELARRIKDGTLLEVAGHAPVHPGDVFFIPAGTLHAIGAGILIAEIQQSSNVTYRVYDYDRRDKNGNTRPLHIEKALDVLRLTPSPAAGRPQGQPERLPGCTRTLLQSCGYFTVTRMDVDGTCGITVGGDRFAHLLCIDGEGELICGDTRLPVTKGGSVFLPAGCGDVTLCGKLTLLHTTP